jgi:hypothetical protein
MIQQEMGRASGISKPRGRISFYQYCTSKDFYVSENFKSEEEVGNL